MAVIEDHVDLTLEQQTLGQVIQFGLAETFAQAGLEANHFYRQEHALIWEACQQVADAGGTTDLVSVAHRLRQNGHMERIGAPYFSRLVDGVARPALPNVLLSVTGLQELAAARTVHYATLDLQQRLKQPGAMADGVVSQHIDTLQQVIEHQHGTAAPWFDVNGQLTAHERDVRAAESGLRVSLGLDSLDAIIGGIRAGEVLGLLGRPGIGKTVLLSHITRTAADVGYGQVFFSLEMPASQIVGRLKQVVFRVGRQQLEQMTKGGMTDEGLYRRTFDRLILVDTPSLTVAEMSRRVRQIQRGPLANVPIGLVIIDHLGLIGGDRKLQTYDRVSVQARELKELAKRLNCAVIVAVQVNREAGGDGSRELGLGSARDSGVVEEAMDYMVGIRRIDRSLTLSPAERERFKDVILAKVIKNRHGDPGATESAFRFYPVGLRLEEDRSVTMDTEDIAARIAQSASKGRR